MVFLSLLILISAFGVVLAVVLPLWSDILLVAGPCLLAATFLYVRAILAMPKKKNWVLLDGSNIMHWNGNKPKIEVVREAAALLIELGFTPGVVFDANVGYMISGTYQHDDGMARMLGLPEDQVMVVSKGTPADSHLLKVARDLGAKIVTNDRYRDWSADFPEITVPGFLVKGAYLSGKVELDL